MSEKAIDKIAAGLSDAIAQTEGHAPLDLCQTQAQPTCFEQLCAAAWEARMETHGRWPDEGPFAEQVEEVKDWVRDEVRGVLEALLAPGVAEHLERQSFSDEPAARDFRAMIQAALDGK